MASGIRDKVAIIGMGCSKFGERWDAGHSELMNEAFEEALLDAGTERKQIDAAWFGSCTDAISVGNAAFPAASQSAKWRTPAPRAPKCFARPPMPWPAALSTSHWPLVRRSSRTPAMAACQLMTMGRATALQDLPTLIKAGESAYISGGATPRTPFLEALQANPEAARDLYVTTSLAPGIDNPFDFDRLHSTARVTGLFMQESLREAQRQGRYRALSVSYGEFLRHVQTQSFEIGVIQVSPPNAEGRCSLGPSVEFTPVALSRCRRVLALVNLRLPALDSSASLPMSRFDHHCEIDLPMPEYLVDSDETTRAITSHIAAFIDDGCTLQTGGGNVPTALAERMRDRRQLRIHSGLVSDGFASLMEAGALDADFVHTACVASGTDDFYRWLPDAKGLRIAGCETTHGAQTVKCQQIHA